MCGEARPGARGASTPVIEDRISTIAAAARAEGRSHLLEPEGLEVARALGFAVPRYRVVADAAEAAAADLSLLRGERVMVKVVSAEILHKSDVGGVASVPKEPPAVSAAVAAMEERFAGHRVAGYGLYEHVPHGRALGDELLVGLRWTPDFGPVVTLGPGGVDAEHLAAHLEPDRGVVVLAPGLPPPEALPRILAGKAIPPVLVEAFRGQAPRLPMERLCNLLCHLLDAAKALLPATFLELELNPLALTDLGPVALDALARLGRGEPEAVAQEPPRTKVARLLAPRSIAVVGVSEELNPGRIILRNILRQGFDRRRLWVVKPGVGTLDGCPAVPEPSSLPEKMDLIVLAVDAARALALAGEIVAGDLAEAVVLIPGGLGETPGSEGAVEELRAQLASTRRDSGRGPVIQGGNCLGTRSVPGRYDTLFIPGHKLRFPQGTAAPLAILSQSGAFAVARASKLSTLNPRYLISYGNQLDLTVGDFLTHLADDSEIAVFACYVEGFRPLDGRRFLRAAAEIGATGRAVILYRAGRSEAGARATASHTATVAGDYTVTRELARAAGVVLADSLTDFEDLVRLFVRLRGRELRGLGLGAVSNAGFECVAMADNLGPFELPGFGVETVGRLEALLGRHRLETVVEVGNPQDLTPIVGDAGFEEAVRAVLEDPAVDAAVVGCVPLTGALATLAPGEGHGEDLDLESSVATRLAALWRESSKPWLAVVDAGPLYDPMVSKLEQAGVPTFRSVDHALRLFGRWARWARAHPGR